MNRLQNVFENKFFNANCRYEFIFKYVLQFAHAERSFYLCNFQTVGLNKVGSFPFK